MASRYSGGRASRYAAQFGTSKSLPTPEEQAAKNAGFASVADQMANRMMRNQLEEKAMRLGVSLQDAYALAGSDLTNTQALQNAWNQLKESPAPAPAAPASSSQQEPQLTAEAKRYREESEAKLAEAQKLLDDFKIEQNKDAEARKLQEQMAIRAQGTLASNLAMSQRQPSLQLSPASQTPQIAGTQPFKRRRPQVMTPGSQVTSGLNIGSANLLNV